LIDPDSAKRFADVATGDLSRKDSMNRRQFTKTAVLAPIAMALARESRSQQNALPAPTENAAPVASAQHVPKTAAAYNRHPPINEPYPFADRLVFVRKELRPRLRAFALDEIQLDPGPLQEARDWNRAYMMRLPNDRLLHNFRVNAGIASEAQPLGGWEAPHSELRGHFVGHYMSAAAQLYAATGDATIKTKADRIVAGIAECQKKLDNNGYVSAFPTELFDRLDRRAGVWAPFYTLHKIMAGLLDMHVYAANSQALDVVVKLASWVDTWTADKPEEHMQDILRTEYGGMNDVLYHLAEVTGNDRWALTGDRFTKKIFFTPLALRQDQLKGLHANTHMPQVVGAARRYELSSDARFGAVAEFFWETVAESRTYVTGGSANTESWLTNANHLALEMQASSHHQECCCAYNMMKLTRHLFAWTADARYIDYYERNLFNHRLGTIQPETGLTTYFLSMSPGAWKTLCTEDQTFWCCTGSALEDFAKLNDTIYFRDDDGLYVNLLVSSKLYWKERGIRLHQATRFPESDRTELTVQASPANSWTLHLRVPSWTTPEASVRINGQLIEVAGSPGSYFAIHRAWKAGDRIEFVTPMQLGAESPRDDPSRQAFLYGPIVLAGQFPRDGIDDYLMQNQGPELAELPPFHAPALSTAAGDPGKWIKPVQGQPLTFRTTGQAQDLTLKPMNQSWDRFVVYWALTS
jgi:DUF1680 family protein